MEDKVFKIEKVIHRVDKYEVYAICEFILASTLFSVNKKVRHTCFKCNHKFQDDDVIYLGLSELLPLPIKDGASCKLILKSHMNIIIISKLNDGNSWLDFKRCF